MKALVCVGPSRLEVREIPCPVPGEGQVRIRTGACGICATDLLMIAGHERAPPGSILGHEWSGVVDAVGPGVDAAWLGRRCVAENVLADGGEVGFEHPGGYAEYFLTEVGKLETLPPDFPFAVATLIEPLAVCLRGLHRLVDLPAGRALVLGDGPIGLLMLALLCGRGCAVTLVGGRRKRLALADRLGAVACIDYHRFRGDLGEALRPLVKAPVRLVVEASGSAAAAAAALTLVHGGTLLILGDYGAERARFPWNMILHREITVVGSNASAGAWPEAVRWAVGHRELLEALVTHRYPVWDFEKALRTLQDRDSGAVKVVLQWLT